METAQVILGKATPRLEGLKQQLDGLSISQGLLDQAENIHAPMLVHIGAEDPICPPQTQAEIRKALAGNPLVKLITHIGAGHAFARRGTPTYNEVAARTANLQSLEFMQRLERRKKNKGDKS